MIVIFARIYLPIHQSIVSLFYVVIHKNVCKWWLLLLFIGWEEPTMKLLNFVASVFIKIFLPKIKIIWVSSLRNWELVRTRGGPLL